MLRCADGTYYVGQTSDLAQRVDEHQSGVVRGYTSSRRPVELIWSEGFEERAQAMEAERAVKGWSRVKKEALVAGDWDRLKFFSVPPSDVVAPNGEEGLGRVTPRPCPLTKASRLRSTMPLAPLGKET